MPTRKTPRAFTLIELLIVIAIIGLIATISAVGINGARAKSRDNKRVADLKQIQKALELSYAPASGYPVVASGTVLGAAATKVLCGKGASSAFVTDSSVTNCDADKLYMGLVPSNPTPNGSSYTYKSTDGNGNLCTTAPCNGYCVQANLEQGLAASGLSAGNFIIDQTALKNGTCP